MTTTSSKPPLFSIRRTMPALIVLPIIATVFLTGLMSYFNSRRSVEKLALQINAKAAIAIEEYLFNLLSSSVVQVQTQTAQFTTPAKVENFAEMQAYFWSLMQQSKVSRNAFFGNPDGYFLSVERTPEDDGILKIRDQETGDQRLTYALDDQGQRQDLLTTLDYDPRERIWYQIGQDLQPNQTAWSPVYVFATTGVLGLTAVQPAYEGNTLLGVFGIDVSLSEIQTFLQKLELSPGAEIFIVERDGTLIATTQEDQPLFQSTADDADPERINILEITDLDLQAIAQHIYEMNGQDWQKIDAKDFFAEKIGNTKQFIGVLPLADGFGIDWIVVLALPESDFQSIIWQNAQSTLVIGGIIAIAGTVVGLLVARWIVRPIDNLNTAAIAIEDQTFQPETLTATCERPDELGQLATVFQRMGTVICANQASLEEQKTALEAEVAQAKRSQLNQQSGYTLEVIQDLLDRAHSLSHPEERLALTDDELRPLEVVHIPREVRPAPRSISVADLLLHVPYFENLSPVDIDHLLDVGEQRTIPAGTVIFNEGEPGNSFYIILSGRVDIRVDGLNKFLTQVQTGGFFGELSLLLGLPRTATVRTLEPTHVFCLNQDGLRYLMQREPGLTGRIAGAIHHHRAELASRQAWLIDQGILSPEDDLQTQPEQWIRQRLQDLFGKDEG